MLRVMLIAMMLLLPALASAQSIEGVWRLAEYESDNVSPAEPHGLMIFADGHYSRVFVRSADPREPVGDSPTPEQQVASWAPFIANSGTYTIEGATLTLQPTVAKVVGAIGNPMTAQVRFEGDSVRLSGVLEGADSQQRWERVD